jgi:Fe-S-cluster containining protein
MQRLSTWDACKPGCGECCGCVPIPVRIYKTHKKHLQRPVIEEVQMDHLTVYPLTEDFICAFLTPEKRCAIYKHRPKVCRLFGTILRLQCCYFDVHGKPREPLAVKHIKDLIDADIETKLSAFGVKYGIKFKSRFRSDPDAKDKD